MILSNRDYTVGWIAALPLELSAAGAVLDQPLHPPLEQAAGDTNTYTLGSIGSHHVVLACLPSMGNNAAAFAAANMLRSFPNVRIGLMVGVGGGVPDVDERDIRLGDIVVGTPDAAHGGIVQFDFGTAIQSGDTSEFVLKGYLNRPPQSLMSALRTLQAKAEREGDNYARHYEEMIQNYPNMAKTYSRPNVDDLYSPEYAHPGNKSNCKLCSASEIIERDERNESVVHYGLIGSSNQVLRNAMLRDQWHANKGIICFEMEAAGLMNDFPCLVIRGICDYCDSHKNKNWQRYASAQAAAFAKELLLNVSTVQIETTPTPSWILEAIDELKIIKDVKTDIDLSKLPSADSAAFDSASNQLEPLCHEETRIEVRKQIREFLNKPDGKCMFWLNGIPGSGKSTLSRTLARELADNGQLAASFFFKRGEGDRGDASRFITTIAKQMIHNIPATKQAISEALTQNSSIIGKSFSEQFEKLILQPLSTVTTEESPRALVFLIDALDECSSNDHLRMIIELFSQVRTLATKRFKIFMTSRPEFPIQQSFRNITSDAYDELLLHEIPTSVLKNDIFVFMRHHLTNVQRENDYLPMDWPGEDALHSLVELSQPLFISASTICRFISDHRWDPQDQLDTILQYRHASQMDQFAVAYQPVLDQMLIGLPDSQRQKLLAEFQTIVGTVVLLEDALSINSLSALLSIAQQVIVRRLKTLHSVLKIPAWPHEPVRTYHLSFREYLTSGDQIDNPFVINKHKVHKMVAQRCLVLLNTSECLKQDIFSLDKPGISREELDQPLIESLILPEVRYACLYFTRHLVSAGSDLHEYSEFHTFMTERLLFWIEAVSWLGRVHSAVGMLRALLPLVSSDSDSDFAHRLLADAMKFLQNNQGMLHATPLQLYVSGLLFSSETSLIQNLFARYIPEWTKSLPPLQDYWQQAEFQTSQNHTANILHVTMSHSGEQLASCSADRTIKLWNAMTGELLNTLSDHLDEIYDIVYTADCCNLLSCSRDSTIKIWNASNGALERTLPHQSPINKFTLTQDGRRLACHHLDDHFSIWDMQNYVEEDVLLTRYRDGKLTFAPTGKQFAICGSDGGGLSDVDGMDFRELTSSSTWRIIGFSLTHNLMVVSDILAQFFYVYNTVTRDVIHEFEDCRCSPEAFARDIRIGTLSIDGRYLASTNTQGLFVIRDLLTGSIEHQFQGDSGEFVAAFSSCGLYLASMAPPRESPAWSALALSPEAIRVWCISSGKLKQTFKTNSDYTEFIAFAPGDDRLWSYDYRSISSWNLAFTSPRYIIDRSDPMLHATVISYNGELLASYLQDLGVIRVWNCNTGAVRYDLIVRRGFFGRKPIRFCPQDKYLVSKHYDTETPSCIYQVWDTASGSEKWMFKNSAVTDRYSISPDSELLVVRCARPYEFRIYSMTTGFLRFSLNKVEVTEFDISYDSRLVSIVRASGSVSLWSATSGDIIKTWGVPSNGIYRPCFSPNSKLLALRDGTCGGVVIFGVASGTVQCAIDLSRAVGIQPSGSGAGGLDALFSPDSRYMLSGHLGRMVLLDVTMGPTREILNLKGDERCLFSPDGEMIVVVSSGILDPITILDTNSLDQLRRISCQSEIKYFAFQTHRHYLETNRGLIGLEQEGAGRTSCLSHIGEEIFIAEHWILIGGEKVLWLPPSLRPSTVEYRNGRFALAFGSNSIMVLDWDQESGYRTKWLSTRKEADPTITYLKQDLNPTELL